MIASARVVSMWSLCATLLALAGTQAAAAAASAAGGAAGIADNATSSAAIANEVLHFSYALQNWLDVGKRPCQDFYGFVCGRLLNGSQAQLEQRRQQKQENFEHFIAADNNEQLMDAELKLKSFYESCKRARSADDLKSSFMYRQCGGWPAIDDSPLLQLRRRNLTRLDVLSAFHEVGATYFFQHRIEIRSNKRVVQLQPDETLRYTRRKFEQRAGEIQQEFSVEAGRARLVALEVLAFERSRRELSKQTVPADVVEFTYADFKQTAFGSAGIQNWDAYFRKILGKTLKANDTIMVSKMSKLRGYFELLQNTTMTRLLNWLWIDYLIDKTVTDCQTLAESYFEPIYQHIVERSGIDKVQMAQMYTALGNAYSELLPPTAWIDEMSQINSKQMLDRVIHMTLNGDSTLDADYNALSITNRNFYRNLEKVQRHVTQQKQHANSRPTLSAATVAATNYMRVFLSTNDLLPQSVHNLSAPLNHILVAERFAEQQIAAGSSSTTPGAWRSMDSERTYHAFRRCVSRQQPAPTNASNDEANDLLLKLLAQQQAKLGYERWLKQRPQLTSHIDGLLAAGSLQLTLRKLHFIGSLLVDCRERATPQRADFVHSYLRNLPAFGEAFACRPGDRLYVQEACKVI